MKLTPKHLQAIHLLILDRFDSPDQTDWVAGKVGVQTRTISAWKVDPEFQAEYQRQLDLYRSNFDDIRLADRKERVRVLSDLYDVVEVDKDQEGRASHRDVRLKMALIEQIRMEMGIGEENPNQVHLHNYVGVNLPPRANSYDEWLKQNRAMDAGRPQKALEAPYSAADTEEGEEDLCPPDAA